MIELKLNDHTFQLDKSEMEEKIVQAILDKTEEMNDMNPFMLQTAKSSIGMILGMMGASRRDDQEELNNLEFGAVFVVEKILEAMDNKTLTFHNIKEVESHESKKED